MTISTGVSAHLNDYKCTGYSQQYTLLILNKITLIENDIQRSYTFKKTFI